MSPCSPPPPAPAPRRVLCGSSLVAPLLLSSFLPLPPGREEREDTGACAAAHVHSRQAKADVGGAGDAHAHFSRPHARSRFQLQPDMSSSSTASAASSAAASPRSLALRARAASRALQSLGYPARQTVLRALAAALTDEGNAKRILEANTRDVAAATAAASKSSSAAAAPGTAASSASSSSASPSLSASSLARLQLSRSKLSTLSAGLLQLAEPRFVPDPINRLLKQTLLADQLVLQQRTVPLGVLLVIFESRPDVLPQLVGLAVLSGNGLLLKGGSESAHTLAALYSLFCGVITASTGGLVQGSELVVLVSGRSAVGEYLSLDDCVDLVIPRGGASLVSFVKAATRIPVLAHADGVCHVYLDRDYGGPDNLANFIDIARDAKVDYPAACNAMETLLVHEQLLQDAGLPGTGDASAMHSVVRVMREAGVTLKLGPRALQHARSSTAGAGTSPSPFLGLSPAESLHTEYGDLTCCVDIVPSMAAAITHIHANGSSHTECILTSNSATADEFLNTVDAACVFHNTSTRFADGFRMGLGAEVGISTSRIHARGPVGVEGLCSTKWSLRSGKKEGQTVEPFQKGKAKFINKQMDITAKL